MSNILKEYPPHDEHTEITDIKEGDLVYVNFKYKQVDDWMDRINHKVFKVHYITPFLIIVDTTGYGLWRENVVKLVRVTPDGGRDGSGMMF